MFNAIKSEIYRVLKGKMVYVMSAIAILLPILSVVFITLFKEEAINAGLYIPNYTMGVFFEENSKEFLTGGTGIFFALILGVAFLLEEYHVGMLKMRLLATSRISLYLAKVITLALSMGIIVLSHLVSALVIGGLFYGFSATADQLFNGVFQGVLSLQSMTVIGILFMAFGLLFSKPLSAIGAGIGIFLLWSIVLQLAPDSVLWLIPHGFAVKTVAIDMEAYALRSLLALGLYLIIGLGSGYGLLRRKDLTV